MRAARVSADVGAVGEMNVALADQFRDGNYPRFKIHSAGPPRLCGLPRPCRNATFGRCGMLQNNLLSWLRNEKREQDRRIHRFRVSVPMMKPLKEEIWAGSGDVQPYRKESEWNCNAPTSVLSEERSENQYREPLRYVRSRGRRQASCWEAAKPSTSRGDEPVDWGRRTADVHREKPARSKRYTMAEERVAGG